MKTGKLVRIENMWHVESSDGLILPVNPYQQIDKLKEFDVVQIKFELFAETGIEPFYVATILEDAEDENIEPDAFHYHEIMDRLTLINDLVERQIIDHPVCYKHADFKKMMDDIVSKLADAYIKIGTIHFNNDTENE